MSEAIAAEVSPPPCRICGKPAGWMPRVRRYGVYCGGHNCTSPDRICKQCGQRYVRTVGGTFFCSPVCRGLWHGNKNLRSREIGVCGKCGGVRTTTNMWQLCSTCVIPLDNVVGRLAKHHVPARLVYQLLDDPTCANPGCHVNLLTPSYVQGKARYPLVVDHNHRCCPAEHSCGACVRGLMCPHCNQAYGHLGEELARIAGLVVYHHLVTPPDDEEEDGDGPPWWGGGRL
jgi:Recombination endonuclease VII